MESTDHEAPPVRRVKPRTDGAGEQHAAAPARVVGSLPPSTRVRRSSSPYGNDAQPYGPRNGDYIRAQECSVCDEPHPADFDADGSPWCYATGTPLGWRP